LHAAIFVILVKAIYLAMPLIKFAYDEVCTWKIRRRPIERLYWKTEGLPTNWPAILSNIGLLLWLEYFNFLYRGCSRYKNLKKNLHAYSAFKAPLRKVVITLIAIVSCHALRLWYWPA